MGKIPVPVGGQGEGDLRAEREDKGALSIRRASRAEGICTSREKKPPWPLGGPSP